MSTKVCVIKRTVDREGDSLASVACHITRNTFVHPRILSGHAINPQRPIGQYVERGCVFHVRDVLAVGGPRDLRCWNSTGFAGHQDWIVNNDCVLVV